MPMINSASVCSRLLLRSSCEDSVSMRASQMECCIGRSSSQKKSSQYAFEHDLSNSVVQCDDRGKIPALPLISAVPFGMEPWEFMAWWYHAGGSTLAEELYAPHNIHPILCGIISPETAGWFRKEIN